MDYTTVERIKQEMHIQSSTSEDDDLLALLATAASRTWDRLCTGVPDAVDYFATEDMADEVIPGQIDYTGARILCYPHKPIINSVASFSYRLSIITTAYSIDASRIEIDGGRVTAYPNTGNYLTDRPYGFPSKTRVTISYNGGLSISGSGMPADMQEAVAILAARFYREAETGLADQIGVAELTTMVYTRAIPVRVANLAELYKRRVGWRHVA